jgi:uncharacterized protein
MAQQNLSSERWRQLHLPKYITIADAEAIRDLVQQLGQNHGRVLVSLTLFGSKARGDDTADSDIDILVIVNSDDWTIRYAIRMLGAQLSFDHEVLFNLYVLPQERWDWMQSINHPLCREILRDGVPLPLPVLALQL